ncbi:unnamed protein product, partial [Vitis vinifera]|uniref:Uncharacterized protein n=1 Tax=Vitis vinifera TaxID=29760 RepID=D7T317_VITVI
MWVCVSDDFDVKVLVRNIIKSATNRDVENLELDQLQQLLKQNLDGKRTLDETMQSGGRLENEEVIKAPNH